MKTEICAFSGRKVMPGRGVRFVRCDSRSFFFLDSKSRSFFAKKKNPRQIDWTVLFRKLHHKDKTASSNTAKRKRKTVKVERAVVGASLQLIRDRRNQKPEVRQAQREAAVREAKEKKKAAKEARKRSGATKALAKQSKQQQKAPKGSKKGGGGKGR
mmetsp:Transcript_49961/g.122686  ORF Transcript_49961/g.122686 Transcript_49961/m.122686 type:complete len:157 (-) Transcript_49961:55-525(-)|eukprot:CAMPEP_0198337748 /NCGR_PEP_ID=MMETSP1450-20131203/30841_1 /TAXON_ID=753684 ORGANISM="Madagascaria erythrocladiodes, Strain CCMP3234" /NCGR_SAMPLE_ID=MMETSP1450 /ASSEMBLY_ACC=CAM_ASM_001115 /LENGTH=156 /DNA_ID=CAMNT_0044042577 /DNA_START=107 /DNA_END=577 /DNA_ORIENTATION=+